jgi:hypothetical protein
MPLVRTATCCPLSLSPGSSSSGHDARLYATGKTGGPLTQRMRKKIDDGGFETPYRLRKQVVEPVFGQIKQARGFRQFLLRGVEKVRAEWALLLKLFTLANAA